MNMDIHNIQDKFNKQNSIAIGVITILTIIFGYIAYTQYMSSTTIRESGSYLQGDFFDKLKKIKDDNITFKDIDKSMDEVFKILTDTRDVVERRGDNGRENPFVK